MWGLSNRCREASLLHTHAPTQMDGQHRSARKKKGKKPTQHAASPGIRLNPPGEQSQRGGLIAGSESGPGGASRTHAAGRAESEPQASVVEYAAAVPSSTASGHHSYGTFSIDAQPSIGAGESFSSANRAAPAVSDAHTVPLTDISSTNATQASPLLAPAALSASSPVVQSQPDTMTTPARQALAQSDGVVRHEETHSTQPAQMLSAHSASTDFAQAPLVTPDSIAFLFAPSGRVQPPTVDRHNEMLGCDITHSAKEQQALHQGSSASPAAGRADSRDRESGSSRNSNVSGA
jgi:hypothetical protein